VGLGFGFGFGVGVPPPPFLHDAIVIRSTIEKVKNLNFIVNVNGLKQLLKLL
jgi:hypothetical protein